MKLSISILESNIEINAAILNGLLPQVNKYMDWGIGIIKNELPQIISNSIMNSPEYQSLLSGELRYEFGISDPGPKLAGLVDIWANNIHYTRMKPTITGDRIRAFFAANTMRVDCADVIYTDYALVVDGTRGYTLPWLEWLLLDGNTTIVDNYEVVVGANKYSRTGKALMKPSSKSWKVPSLYAGTASDNWITRAIDSVTNDIDNLLNKAFNS